MWVENKSGGGEKKLSEKSNTPQCESRIRFLPCIGVRSISVSQGLFGRHGVGANQKSSVKTNEADPKDQPHSVYVLRAK